MDTKKTSAGEENEHRYRRTAGKTGGLWDFKELEAFDGKMD